MSADHYCLEFLSDLLVLHFTLFELDLEVAQLLKLEQKSLFGFFVLFYLSAMGLAFLTYLVSLYF